MECRQCIYDAVYTWRAPINVTPIMILPLNNSSDARHTTFILHILVCSYTYIKIVILLNADKQQQKKDT